MTIHYVPFAVKEEGVRPEDPALFDGRAPFDDGKEYIDPWTFEPYADTTAITVPFNEPLLPWPIKSAGAQFIGNLGAGRLYAAEKTFPERFRAKTYVASAAYAREGGEEDFQAASARLKNGLKELVASISPDESIIVLAMPQFQAFHRFKDDAIIHYCRVRFLTVDTAEAEKLLGYGVIRPYAEKDAA